MTWQSKEVIPMNVDFSPKRTVKDTVFTHLFRDKQYTLQLFHALHPEVQDVTEDMIEIVTLEHVLVDRDYNDLGFRVGDRLIVLVEAQSTWSLNIAVRAMLYLAKTYQEYINRRELNIYSKTQIHLPKSELYVIYTGNTRIEKDDITLSGDFFGGERNGIDVWMHVLTDGKPGDIIYQYVAFTKVIDGQVGLYGRTPKAITEAIRICKDRDLLKQYLIEHETEVTDIMITLFDYETVMKNYEKETFEKGREEGREEGRDTEKRENVRNLLAEGVPERVIANALKLPLSEVTALKAEMTQ